MATDHIGGGYDTARVTSADADQQIRADREADARRYLTRTDNADLLPILGLAPELGCCRHCGRARAAGDGYCKRGGCQAARREAARVVAR